MIDRLIAVARVSALAGLFILVVAATGPRTLGAEVPEGLPAGPWIFSPFLVFGYEYDSNPLFRPESVGSDRIAILTPGLGAFLPIGNSGFRLQVERSHYNYELLDLDDNQVTEIHAAADLGFSSSDRLLMAFDRTSGLARTVQAFDEGGEAVFQGDTFDLNKSTVELSRSVYGHRGYLFRVERRDLVFDPNTTANFFNYRGWSYAAEYREPVSPQRWLVVALEGRKYDHFQVLIEPGAIYRQEDSRMVYIGLDGRFTRQWRTRVRLGYGDFRFPMADGQDFSGVVGDFNLSYRSPGERLDVQLLANRRPYASFFFNNTYYLNTSVGLNANYAVRPRLTFGGRAFYGHSTYGDRLVNPGDPQEGLIREDQFRTVELSGRVDLAPWVGITVSARESRRTSNYEGVEYEAKSVFGGLAIGWQ